MRGFGRTGDYNSRVLVLVDGQRINDPVYDTGPIGTEFPLDVDLIKRVEIVRGPGSSVYGSNAVFAIVNVITKNGTDINGLETAGTVASFGTDKERGTWGGKLKNGFEWLVSGTRYYSKGQNLYFPEFDTPSTNNGVAVGLDGDHYEQAFAKLKWRGFTLSGMYSDRLKHVPTASYGTQFNNPRTWTDDAYKLLDLKYQGNLGERWAASGHLFYGDYPYQGSYPYGPPPIVINWDFARSQWWGADAQLVGNLGRHKLLFGGDYQDNFRQDQNNYDQSPYYLYLDDRRRSEREGIFVQDELSLPANLLLNAGVRWDHYSTIGGSVNPRLALIWSPSTKTNVKLMYGTAFRAPNSYELFYGDGSTQKGNPNLKPEEVTTYEIALDHYLDPSFKVTADIYYNQIHHLIDQVTDPADGLLVFENIGGVRARGIELSTERIWQGGTRLRASYAWQIAQDRRTDTSLVNSPRHLVKLNFSVPLWQDRLRASTDVQYTSRRKTLNGAWIHGYTLVNFTLLSDKLVRGLTVSTTFYNLFDEHYADPGALEHVQNVIPQDGRSFRLKLEYRFW